MSYLDACLTAAGLAVRSLTSRLGGPPPEVAGNDHFSGAPKVTHYPSAPWSIRMEGNDAQTWIEPTSKDYSQLYLNYFAGNQLPGFFQRPNLAQGAVNPIHIESPSRNQGSFGPNLGQVSTANLAQRWAGIWAAASNR